MDAADVNVTRFDPTGRGGHYESFFVRANHPSQPLAFWIRYTIFCPRGAADKAIGELWAVYFDGHSGCHAAAKSEVPLSRCSFSATELNVRIEAATLQSGKLEGCAGNNAPRIGWDLRFTGNEKPVFLLPARLYDASLPKAKSLVSLPMACFSGRLTVADRVVEVVDWIGSQNHNWGSRHTDLYAWGQVAGFDTQPDSFLEVATAQVKIGPVWSPPMTPLVLRHRGEEYALNEMGRTWRAHGRFSYFNWEFASENDDIKIEGVIEAPRQAFVGLRYYNPPGGIKHCLNSKLAACELRFTDKRSGSTDVLRTAHRAAFEILTDDTGHGIEMRV